MLFVPSRVDEVGVVRLLRFKRQVKSWGERSRSGSGEAHDAPLRPACPALPDNAFQDGRAQRTAEVAAPLTPAKATAAKGWAFKAARQG